MSEIAIRAEGLGKKYYIGRKQAAYKTLRETLTDTFSAPFRRVGQLVRGRVEGVGGLDEALWALRNVSFEVKQGEVVGIIGRNGAGKSTLLKILSRITEPAEGYVDVYGRVGALLEVGTGFHHELTGRENIYLNGAILGMSRAEINRRFDEIVAFAEVEKFIDTPVKHYSSGMALRLGFAVAAHLEPEILVVDEVLAVGDSAFQKKCIGKIGDVARGGRTVLFVSHNMAAVQNLCQKGILLHQGQVKYIGTQSGAIEQYLSRMSEPNVALYHRKDRQGTGEVRITGIELKDTSGKLVENIACGQDVDVYIYFETKAGFKGGQYLYVSLWVKTVLNVPVFAHHNRLTEQEFGELPEQGAFVCRLLRLPLTPSTYNLSYEVRYHNDVLDAMSDAGELTVVDGDFYGSGEVPPASLGVCVVDADWRLESDVVESLEGLQR